MNDLEACVVTSCVLHFIPNRGLLAASISIAACSASSTQDAFVQPSKGKKPGENIGLKYEADTVDQ